MTPLIGALLAASWLVFVTACFAWRPWAHGFARPALVFVPIGTR